MNPDAPTPSRGVVLSSLSLFTSVGTLLCCALPALLVTLGLGASLAGLISAAPWITTISAYKTEIFFISGVLLLVSTTLIIRARKAPCPIDKDQAIACRRLRTLNIIFTGIAWLTYGTGFFFAFLASYVLL